MKNLIEEIKHYWDSRPCNIRHGTANIGTKEYFDQVEQRRYMVEPHGYTFATFDQWAGKKVLEIGCGIGTDAVNFVRAGAEYTGIDLSEKSIDLCKRRFEVYNLNGRLFAADAEQLDQYFQGETFDLIYSFGVIHHSENPKKIVDQLSKFMHSGSELRIMLYSKNSWKNIMIQAGLDQPEAQSGCPQALTYSKEQVKELLDQFDVLDIEQTFIFPWQIDKYVKYEYVKQPWFAAMSNEMFSALEKSLGWHLLIRAKLKGLT